MYVLHPHSQCLYEIATSVKCLFATLSQHLHTALHKASEGGHAEAISELLKRGADPNALDKVRHVHILYLIFTW